jgi:hypothetical protein
MRVVKNIFVNGISLVTKDKAPAVEQAENKFALFKVKENSSNEDLTKIRISLQKNTLKEIENNIKNVLL